MTMQREAKEAMLHRHIAILIGEEKIPSPSPRRIAEFGRYAPADWAAALIVRVTREARTTTREIWATERLGRRQLVRR